MTSRSRPSRRRERPWWEDVTLVHVMAHAQEFRATEDLARKIIMRQRMEALGRLLRNLRFVHRRRALEEMRRVSEELGLYEEDA